MKKTVLTFGLISGAISSLLMVATLPFLHKIGFNKGLVVGYTSIVLSFLLVFFGIRSYRENAGGGTISFGRAFAVGILIAFISSVCYVISREVIYYWFAPDFTEKSTAYMVETARAAGQSQLQISA